MPLDIPRIKLFGRPFKPVSLGFMLAMLVLAFTGWTDVGDLDDSIWGDVVSVGSAFVAVWLFLAWYKRSQYCAEIGLLMVFGVLVFRAVFAFLLLGGLPAEGYVPEATLLSLSFALIAGGAWWLEYSDPDAPQKWGDG